MGTVDMMFGNLSIEDFERRGGFELSDEDREWLESHRQDNATVRSDSDKFHIFDLPFMIVVAPPAFAELISVLEKYEFTKESLQIAKATETDEERWEKERELQRQALEKKKQDPNIHWLKKWMLRIPVGDMEYEFFINTGHWGYYTIPDEIKGTFTIYQDKVGLHGRFELDSMETPEDNFVVGIGMYRGEDRLWTHDKDEFSFHGRIEEFRCPNKDCVL